MYPFAAGLYAPCNRWYVAARSAEVGRAPMERFILNAPVVFYRTEAGEPVALAGRCPRRGYPLGKSRVDGDSIVSGYHGPRFEADGRSSHTSGQAIAPPKARVKAYPLAELHAPASASALKIFIEHVQAIRSERPPSGERTGGATQPRSEGSSGG